MLGKNDDEVFETLKENNKEQYVVRAYTDIVTTINKPVVAFDLDGTLLDSRKRHSVVLDYVLKKYSIKIDTSNLIEYKSSGRNNIDFLIENGISEDLAKSIQREWIKNIENHEFLKLDVLYPDAISNLEKYSQKNDLILITARSNEENVRKQLNELDISKYFKQIFVVRPDHNVSDEKAKILIKEKAVSIHGDTKIDKNAANKANINMVFYPHGFQKKLE